MYDTNRVLISTNGLSWTSSGTDAVFRTRFGEPFDLISFNDLWVLGYQQSSDRIFWNNTINTYPLDYLAENSQKIVGVAQYGISSPVVVIGEIWQTISLPSNTDDLSDIDIP